MPARFQVQHLLMNFAVRAAPAQFDRQVGVRTDMAEAEVKLLAALSRMPAAAINLRDKPPAIRQQDGRLCANRRPATRISFRVFRQRRWRGARTSINRQEQAKREEGADIRASIDIRIRRHPLVGDNEVQLAISVEITDADAATDLRLVEA